MRRSKRPSRPTEPRNRSGSRSLRTTTQSRAFGGAAQAAPPPRSARVAALKLLAARRLSEAQLWKKLEAKGYPEDAVAEAVESCRRDGYVDDALFAALYVEGARKAVGDARLVAELVKRGIDREAALRSVAAAPRGQSERIAGAYEKLMRTKPNLSYQSAARALERLGFPTSLIYRALRDRAHAELGAVLDLD